MQKYTWETSTGKAAKTPNGLKAKRTYKSRLFEMIFSQKKELLELYNAVNGTTYEDPELLEITYLGECHIYVHAQ